MLGDISIATDIYIVTGYTDMRKSGCCCWTHICRYLLDTTPKGQEKDYSHPAVQGMLYCNNLFEYERSPKEKDLSFKRIYNRCRKDHKPVIEGFLAWLK